ncbi:MAG: universal stress protein [Gammaproteobacteria bacterium]|jgi:nucleotide-binding universal stress UspA family protein
MAGRLYRHIGVPVDLAHRDKLGKAIATAVDLAGIYGARITLVSVTGPAPGEAAHNPQEYRRHLQDWAAEITAESGIQVDTETEVIGDPAADLDKSLDHQFHALGVDLVVMASHVPGFREYVFHSNAGFLASHTDLSVFVVRGTR